MSNISVSRVPCEYDISASVSDNVKFTNCHFSSGIKFGNDCEFVNCSFSGGHVFGDRCSFIGNISCNLGGENFFGKECIFYFDDSNTIDFGERCKFDNGCKFGDAGSERQLTVNFGKKCYFNEPVFYTSKTYFGDNCRFDNGVHLFIRGCFYKAINTRSIQVALPFDFSAYHYIQCWFTDDGKQINSSRGVDGHYFSIGDEVRLCERYDSNTIISSIKLACEYGRSLYENINKQTNGDYHD